jgi:hypothetical protein
MLLWHHRVGVNLLLVLDQLTDPSTRCARISSGFPRYPWAVLGRRISSRDERYS